MGDAVLVVSVTEMHCRPIISYQNPRVVKQVWTICRHFAAYVTTANKIP
jgi:hypothetical protein